jgi:DNA-binding transcriptional MerR regulator
MAHPQPKRQGQSLRISDVAQQAAVSKQTIEYYILIGLLAPRRSPTGRRLFDAADIRRVKLIRKLNQSGYTLAEIRQTFLKA